MHWNGDKWVLVGNEKEKEEMTTENQKDRERAIISPQIGDRWSFNDGTSIEVSKVEQNLYYFVTSDRKMLNWHSDSWRQYLHAAKFLGNFNPKTEKRDPIKNPKVGDKWEVFQNYRNHTYYGTNWICTGQFLIISVVEKLEKDMYITGYFMNGEMFRCSLTEFPARSQAFKFICNIDE